MKTYRKLICLILVLVVSFAITFSISTSALDEPGGVVPVGYAAGGDDAVTVTASGFVYEHDPRDNPEAMKDIVWDENTIYGFRPSKSGSLKQYAELDWTDPVVVANGREERIGYHNSLESMTDTLIQMQDEGKSTEEIARTLSKMRNDIRIESYKDDPEGLALMKERNLEKYGHEEGPTPEQLYELYGSWEKVIEKAFSVNVGMDACLGLYDDYYSLYVLLGQAEDDTEGNDTNIYGDVDGDGEVDVIDVTCIQRKLADLPTPAFIEEAADVDGDNEITIADAVWIQRYLAQIPSYEIIGKPIV